MKHLLFLCFLFVGWVAKAQYIFHTLDVKSGMSDNYVQSILRDRYGFMWFGTINGLNRYDGYHCKTYLTTPLGTYNNSTRRSWKMRAETFGYRPRSNFSSMTGKKTGWILS